MSNAASRAKTGDRGPPADGPEIFTVEQIGPNRARTPNGNMVCYDVPIARVGWMIYGPGETPIEIDPETGYARVYRSEEELFSPTTIGSFMGVAITDEHPEDDVDPSNWDKLSRGFTTTNVRRGTGENADCLVADLIITRDDLIKAIDENKREVSCGYSADYKQTGPGTGVQTNIIGNHLALVERGRCGPRCAIGDHAPSLSPPINKEPKMDKKLRVRLETANKQRMRTLVRDMQGLLEETSDPVDQGGEEPDGDEGGATHIHIHTNGSSPGAAAPDQRALGGDDMGDPDAGGGGEDPTEARFTAIEQSLAQLNEAVQAIAAQLSGATQPAGDAADPDEPDVDPEDPDKVKVQDAPDFDPEDPDGMKAAKTGDSSALATSFQQLLADAEILVPGFRAPTFDAKAKRATTIDQMCKLRRQAVTAAMATQEGAFVIEAAAGPKCDVAGMNCQGVAQLFRAAVTARKVMNNAAATRDAGKLPNGGQQSQRSAGAAPSLAEINQQNDAFWAKQMPTGL